MDKLIIIKELGHGVFGTTFLVQDEKGNKYALKREKILKGEMIKTTKLNLLKLLMIYHFIL